MLYGHNKILSTTPIDRTGEKMTVFMSIEIKFTKVGHIVNVICILEVLHFYFCIYFRLSFRLFARLSSNAQIYISQVL